MADLFSLHLNLSALLTYAVSHLGGARVHSSLKTFITDLGMLPIPTLTHVQVYMLMFRYTGCNNSLISLKYFFYRIIYLIDKISPFITTLLDIIRKMLYVTRKV